MSASEPTVAEVGHDLAVFGNYRVLRTQQLAGKTQLHPSVLMSLGLRESGLTNVCGGAKLENGVWVETFSDRGCFQISDQIPSNAAWLIRQEGCANGAWGPAVPATSALTPMHVPRFTPAAEFTIQSFELNRSQAIRNGVPAEQAVRFAIAAHNAGFQGALDGWREGNVDLHTTHGDYSKWVLKYAQVIHNWVVAHPAWVYKGQKLLPEEQDMTGTAPVLDGAIVAVPGEIADAKNVFNHATPENVIKAGADVSTLIGEAPTILEETRHGWKTSEFWVGIAAAVQAVATELPQTDKVALIALAAVYAIARGIAKHGIPSLVKPPVV